VSAIEIPPGPPGPEPASEPVLVVRAEGHAASRWYRQPALVAGLVILAVVVGLALAAPLITSYNPITQNLSESLLGPSRQHLLGTDQLGRDTFTRLLYGLRLDLRIGFIAVLLPFMLGLGARALPFAIGITAVSLFGVGALLSLFTGRSALQSGTRMLVLGALAGAVTYGIGLLAGMTLG